MQQQTLISSINSVLLSAGDVSANSTEAINGSQVYSLSDQFAKYLDVSAGYDAKGEWKAPSFTVNAVKDDGVTIEEKKYATVAEALSDVGNSFTNIKKILRMLSVIV